MEDTFQRIVESGQTVGFWRLPADGIRRHVPVAVGNSDFDELTLRMNGGYVPLPADPEPIRYSEEVPIRESVTTVGTVPAIIWRLPIKLKTGYDITIRLLAVSDNGLVWKTVRDFTIKRLTAGPAQVGTTATPVDHRDTGTSAWTIVPSISGNDGIITVTGSSGRTVSWQIRGSYISFAREGIVS
jgi:hypothetical protein